MRAAGDGLAAHLCRYHVQRKARHGSPWADTLRAADLQPYVRTAAAWIRASASDPAVVGTLADLEELLARSGRPEDAMHIKRKSATERARIAFARLRVAGVGGDRILALYLGVCAAIEDDRDAHQRNAEYRQVQAAKAIHRLASGTHRTWDFPLADGTTAPLHLHVYPLSRGLVLRRIGEAVEGRCRRLAVREVDDLRALKLERFGPHPSHAPGWQPRWKRQQQAAA